MKFICIHQSVLNNNSGCYEEHYLLLSENESHAVSLVSDKNRHLTLLKLDFNTKSDALYGDCFNYLSLYFGHKTNIIPPESINTATPSLGLIQAGCLSMTQSNFDYSNPPRESQWIQFVTENATSYYDISNETIVNLYLAYLLYDNPIQFSLPLVNRTLSKIELAQCIKQIVYGGTPNANSALDDSHYNDDIDLNDFEIQDGVLVKYLGHKPIVKIPTCVNKIGYQALWNNPNIYAVIIPDSVTELDKGVFECCESLTHVVLSNYIGALPADTFYGCPLESIIIPPSIKSIKQTGFSQGYQIIAQKCSHAITFAKRNFNKYEELDEADFKTRQHQLIDYINQLKVMDNVVYDGNTLLKYTSSNKNFTIPEGVKSIGDNAFNNNSFPLFSITLPSTLETIGNYAFCGCDGLKSLVIPDSVTEIGKFAFYHTGLTQITLPRSLVKMGSKAFKSCSSLTHVSIPEGVTTIGVLAFDDCPQLKEVQLPSTLTSLKVRAFAENTTLIRNESLNPLIEQYLYDSYGIGWYQANLDNPAEDPFENIAYCYQTGKYVKQDYQKALEWYQKADEKRYYGAAAKIGLFYEQGLGVPQDYSKALEWYLKGAEHSHEEALWHLGALYYNGLGVPQNYEMALSCYLKLTTIGPKVNYEALSKIFELYEKGYIPKDCPKLLEYYQYFINRINKTRALEPAIYIVEFHDKGFDIQEDAYSQAIKRIKWCAEAHNSDARDYCDSHNIDYKK